MMIYDDLWWFMMIYDDLWWFMMIYDDLWWFTPKNDEIVHYWLVVWTPLKNMNVNCDDDIPNIWENKKWQPHHQPDEIVH